MRRVLAPLRRCFADDGRRTRLRALYEDAALVRGSDAAVIGETDPTTVIADRKIADAARRGLDLGTAGDLARYRRLRRADIAALLAATDGLTWLFSNDIPPVRLARDLGLGEHVLGYEDVPDAVAEVLRVALDALDAHHGVCHAQEEERLVPDVRQKVRPHALLLLPALTSKLRLSLEWPQSAD